MIVAKVPEDQQDKFPSGLVVHKCAFVQLDIKLELGRIHTKDGKPRPAAVRLCAEVVLQEVSPFAFNQVALTNPMLDYWIRTLKFR